MSHYCDTCGTELVEKDHEEGVFPYCSACQVYKYPHFSVAMSTILLNPEQDRLLLIKQGGKEGYILTAGYVSLGESVEETVVREVQEELGLSVTESRFLRSRYYEPSKTLMMNFVSVVASEDYVLKVDEVDQADWFSFCEAKKAIRSNSLAEQFLLSYLQEASKA